MCGLGKTEWECMWLKKSGVGECVAEEREKSRKEGVGVCVVEERVAIRLSTT